MADDERTQRSDDALPARRLDRHHHDLDRHHDAARLRSLTALSDAADTVHVGGGIGFQATVPRSTERPAPRSRRSQRVPSL
jgi:hypothetical protein